MECTVFTENQAADFLQVTPRTLQAWRYRGGGPKYVRVSPRMIRYRQSDLDAWIDARIASSTSESTEAERAVANE